MLATVSFPIYAQALFNVLIGREQKWHVTGRRARPGSPFNFMVPQVLFFVFLLLTSVVAVWRDVGHSQLTLATVWNITNTVILGVFVARRAARAPAAHAPGSPRPRLRRRRFGAPRSPRTVVTLPRRAAHRPPLGSLAPRPREVRR